MRLDKLTTKFQAAVADAQSLAVGRDHQFIEPIHVLSAMLSQQGGTTRPMLAQAGANVNAVRSELGKALERLPKVDGVGGDVQVSNDLTRALNLADKLAQKRGDQFVSTELFVLGASTQKDALGDLLRAQGADEKALSAAIEQVRGGEAVDDPNAEESRQALERYTIDLTERAELGKLDPVIGRDDEIRRTIQVLARRT